MERDKLINITGRMNIYIKIINIIANWEFKIKSDCKYIIWINLIDMTHKLCYWFKLIKLFSEYMRCLLVKFSGFLLDLVFQGFVVNILMYLFLLYQEFPQLQVSMLVLAATFVLLQFPGSCIIILLQIL